MATRILVRIAGCGASVCLSFFLTVCPSLSPCFRPPSPLSPSLSHLPPAPALAPCVRRCKRAQCDSENDSENDSASDSESNADSDSERGSDSGCDSNSQRNPESDSESGSQGAPLPGIARRRRPAAGGARARAPLSPGGGPDRSLMVTRISHRCRWGFLVAFRVTFRVDSESLSRQREPGRRSRAPARPRELPRALHITPILKLVLYITPLKIIL